MITKPELERRIRFYGNAVVVVSNTEVADKGFLKRRCYLGWKPELKLWKSATMSTNDDPAIKRIRKIYENVTEYNMKYNKNLEMDLLTDEEFAKMRDKK